MRRTVQRCIAQGRIEARPGGLAGRERGFALLVVLWTLVLLALLVARLSAAGRTEAQVAANLRTQAALEAVADGAIYEAAFRLQAADAAWRDDGTPYRLGKPDQVEIRIRNQAGKVNPNLARPALLQALLRELGAESGDAASLAAAIVQWRFPTATGRGEDGGAARYRAAGLAYGPPGTPFQSLDTLGEVLGMSPDLLARMRPHLSLYAGAVPDVRYADPVVKRAMAAAGEAGTASSLPRVEEITATAATPDGGRFRRRAVLRLGASAAEGGFRILEWEAGEG